MCSPFDRADQSNQFGHEWGTTNSEICISNEAADARAVSESGGCETRAKILSNREAEQRRVCGEAFSCWRGLELEHAHLNMLKCEVGPSPVFSEDTQTCLVTFSAVLSE